MEDFLGPNADQQLQVFVEQNLYNYSGKMTNLRLSVDSDMLDVLVDTFGNGFRIVTQNEHKVIVSVTVSDGWGLNTWLLQHGDCVQVLEPVEIREQIRKLVGKIYKSYQGGLCDV